MTTSPKTRTRSAALALGAAVGVGLLLGPLTLDASAARRRGASVATSAVAPRPAVSIPATATATTSLTAAEKAGLLKMREEEKLAHDVYLALYAKWGIRSFANIAASEQTHTTTLASLLARYGIADPVTGKPDGVFVTADMQKLYDKLVAQGSTSEIAALQVGALIEDLDIVDLRTEKPVAADLKIAYANLERGSQKHLRAFTGQLSIRGASYTPTYLSAAEYKAIVG